MDLSQFEERKRGHIRHALDLRHQATGLSGLDRIHLRHEALPDLNLEEITLASTCLGQPATNPFYVAGMTAGHADAVELNHLLARACAKRGWAMGVGSQRRDFESREGGLLGEWQKLRIELPELTLFANLGISQLIDAPLARLQELIHSIHAQALCVHLNAIQECMQPEGTPQFKGGLQALEKLSHASGAQALDCPIVLKETGSGFSARTLKKLSTVNLAAIDVSGLGGTHWGRIEGARAEETKSDFHSQAAQTFANWGETTVDSVQAAAQELAKHPSKPEIWASGGVRSGLDAAKLIALGAHRVGYAQPALQAALQGEEVLNQWMLQQEFELKVALFCTGSRDPAALRQQQGVWQWTTNAI
ncbi:MAG: type 2 isopentenyl-diphosphate Delta-isomerase [Methylotenera sp.]|nr:type 2 isopentenyl-diphosphate Delta-isomerase [Oligoflexia bacterium]